MNSPSIQVLDEVRVTRLRTPTREVTGTQSVLRQPRVGDVGTVVYVLETEYIVECVDHSGRTEWLANFDLDEVEFESRAPGGPFMS